MYCSLLKETILNAKKEAPQNIAIDKETDALNIETQRLKKYKEIELENTEVISEDSFNELSEEEKKEREKIRLRALGELFEKKVIEEKIEEEKEKQKRLEEERKQKLLIDSGLEKPKVILDEETIKNDYLKKKKLYIPLELSNLY